MNRVSDFMVQLSKELMDKKKITESSITLYIKHLWMLNNKQIFNNLMFLKNTEAIDKILSGYKDNSKKTMLSAVVSVLSLYKDKVTYKKIYNHYYDLMMGKAKEMKSEDINEKSNTQNLNWMSWDSVLHIKTNMKEKIDEFKDNKMITPGQFELLLSYVVLSLYTDIPPRRNDYQIMFFVPSYNEKMPQNQNYLDWENKKFIFINYKTAKKYGQQEIDFKDNKDLIDILSIYLKHHPLNPSPSLKKFSKSTMFKFLVYSDGSPLTAVNAITRILNKIFGRKIGSSMLRHIYLSSKYNIKEMKKDAEAMGHSINEQREYLKEDKIDEPNKKAYEAESENETTDERPKPKKKFKVVTL